MAARRDQCPPHPPNSTVGPLGLTQEREGGQACCRQGHLFSGSFPLPHLAVEMAWDTS